MNPNNDEYTPVTVADFKRTIQQVAVTVGTDIRKCIEAVNLVSKQMEELRAELGQAQNETAAIVDALLLHARWLMEQLDGMDAEGKPTEKFKEWCARIVSEEQEARQQLAEAQAEIPEAVAKADEFVDQATQFLGQPFTQLEGPVAQPNLDEN